MQKMLGERSQTFDESPEPIDPDSSREVVMDQLVKSQLRASNLEAHLKDYRQRVEDLRRLVTLSSSSSSFFSRLEHQATF